MEHNNASGQHIEIIELMNNKNTLQAMNNVIKDVSKSGLKTKKFIKKKDNPNYSTHISLIATSYKIK